MKNYRSVMRTIQVNVVQIVETAYEIQRAVTFR